MTFRLFCFGLLVASLAGCGDNRITTACSRECVAGERCDPAQGRCVMNTPPAVTVTLPVANQLVSDATVQLTGRTEDDSGLLREAHYRVGEGEWQPLGLESDGAFETTVSLPALDGAPLTLTVKAVDFDGLEGFTTRTIAVDRVAPRCAFTSPAMNEVLSAGMVTVRATLTDGSAQLGEASLVLDDTTTLTSAATDGQARFEVTLPSLDGAMRRWQLRGRDVAGNRCEASVDVVIDNRGPDVTLTQPMNGQTVTRSPSGAVPVSFTVNDGSGVRSAEVQAPPSTQWQPATLAGNQGTFAWVVPAVCSTLMAASIACAVWVLLRVRACHS
jgi:hypothetical protein